MRTARLTSCATSRSRSTRKTLGARGVVARVARRVARRARRAVHADDDIALEQAAEALAAVENETGRTTDPVRMYMREMGTVDLLTREGEIKIAKRIEEGMRDLLMASSQYPRTVEFVLEFFQLVKDDEKKLNDLMTGFLEEMVEVPSAGPGSEKAKALENSSDDAPDTGLDFKEVQRRMTALKRQYNKTNKTMEKKGRNSAEAQT